MAEGYVIRGGRELNGRVEVKGAKNSVLPLLAASVLAEDRVYLKECPHLRDVDNMLKILRSIGCETQWSGDDIQVDSRPASLWEMPEKLSGELRSSVFMLGPLVGRFGRALATYPGGCEIGLRPIDLHLQGLRTLNVTIDDDSGYIHCQSDKLLGGTVNLDYPSVGATENIMMAAVKAMGKTIIYNAAREPEIEDLQNFLNAMGADVKGAGSYAIEINGVDCLHGTVFEPIKDRIVAGTYLTATAMTGGTLSVTGIRPPHISQITSKLMKAGCRIQQTEDTTILTSTGKLQSVEQVETLPYPGYPTDMQAQLFAMSCIAKGTTVIRENVFESRYRHAPELIRMGAKITVKDRVAVIQGIPRLHGAKVIAGDLRGGAALVLAGLCAEGTTFVSGCEHIDRGYENIETVLKTLGADIRRREV